MLHYILDTNVVVRFLLGEPVEMAESAAVLFDRAESGKLELLFEPVVIAESIFVLTSYYKKARPEVVAVIKGLIESAGVKCSQSEAVMVALKHYEKTPQAHWVDCYLAGLSEIEGRSVVSFDRDFDKLTGSTRLDPKGL